MNPDLMKAAGFGESVKAVEKGLCPFCGEMPGPFKDALSEKEFTISGMCQHCQDDFFGEG